MIYFCNYFFIFIFTKQTFFVGISACKYTILALFYQYKAYIAYISKKSVSLHFGNKSGSSSVGRASASQAEGREFESRFPL